MKKRDLSLDVIRILAIAFILIFHFFSFYTDTPGATRLFANGTWGYLGTSIFFMISGYLLANRYDGKFDVKEFYKKRWLSIYPAFYIAFIGAYVYMLITGSPFFYGGPAYKLIYSLLGIDKYVNWFGIGNYATVGEWFTAVIVFLYILYPGISKFMARAKFTFSTILLILYLFVNLTDTFILNADVSAINALMMFWVGMWIAKYGSRIRQTKLIAVILIAVAAILLFVKLRGPLTIWMHLLAVCIFLVIYILFPKDIYFSPVAKTLPFLAGLSYEVYLVHHFLILVLNGLLAYCNVSIKPAVIFPIYIALTLLLAWMLNIITRFVIGLFSKKEK